MNLSLKVVCFTSNAYLKLLGEKLFRGKTAMYKQSKMFKHVELMIYIGDPEFFGILSAVNTRMGSISLVHIEDLCSAYMFLMEHAKAEGRYICCAQNCEMSKLVELLAKEYSSSHIR